jgi:hypothetical protein
MKLKLKESSVNMKHFKSTLKVIKDFEPREAIFGGAIASLSLLLVLCNHFTGGDKIEIKDTNPVNISYQECTIGLDGKESIYECKEMNVNSIKKEAKNHYDNMQDTCIVDKEDKFNHIVRCYDENIDKIKNLESKINNKEKMRMICLTNKKNQRIRCFRN